MLEDTRSRALLGQKTCSKTTDEWEGEGTVSISYSAHPMLVHGTMSRCTTACFQRDRQRSKRAACREQPVLELAATAIRNYGKHREKSWMASHSNAEIGLFLTSATGTLGTTTSHPHFVQPAALVTTRAPNTDIPTGTQRNASLDMASSFLQHMHQQKTPQ